MEYALEITNFSKEYNGTSAVSDISLTIPKGQFFGLLGPNGAGKTSTIHSITGIAKVTSGSIKVFGIDVVSDYREARKKIGLSPQEFNVDIFAKTWQIIDYMGGYYGMPHDLREKRVQELLEQFDLEKHKDKQFQQLSGGLKRRVVLARALVHDPELLILDEPTAGVDVELRHDLWRYLEEFNKAGKTIILTSHYLEEVERLCERIAIINNGKIVADGEKSEFLKNGESLEETYLKITKGHDW